jgi:hypothetical protein
MGKANVTGFAQLFLTGPQVFKELKGIDRVKHGRSFKISGRMNVRISERRPGQR